MCRGVRVGAWKLYHEFRTFVRHLILLLFLGHCMLIPLGDNVGERVPPAPAQITITPVKLHVNHALLRALLAMDPVADNVLRVL